MNSPEVTMPHALPQTGLAAHAKALDLFDPVRAMTWRLVHPTTA